MASKGGRSRRLARSSQTVADESTKHAKAPSGKTIKSELLGVFVPEDVHLYKLNRHEFTVYLEGESTALDAQNPDSFEPGVEYNMADRFEKNLGILSGIDKNRPILVQMSSCGGLWEEGMKIFGAILTCPNPVTVLATKWARSMTSLIPLAADRFVMRPTAQYMFHHGSYGFQGLTQEAMTEHLELLKGQETMLRIYIARLKEQGKFKHLSEESIRAMLIREMEKRIDVFLSPNEAKSWGLVDHILGIHISGLRATSRNETRRKTMLNVLLKPINIKISVS